MTFEEVLDRFDVIAGGEHPAARCPAHDDRHASLSFAEGDDGRTLMRCFAGCNVHDICGAVNLELSDLFPEPTTRRPLGIAGNGRITIPAGATGIALSAPYEPPEPLPAEHDLERWRLQLRAVMPWVARSKGWSLETLRGLQVGYDGRRLIIPVRDPDGRLVTVLRYRPGGHPKMLAPRGRPRGLFPAPETVVATDLWLVEGEPDAITARELLLPAVSIPGVAVWRQEWADRLRGRTVTICMDADGPGRAAALRIWGDLEEHGIPSVVVELAPTAQDGTDLSDLLLAARSSGRVDVLRRHLAGLSSSAWERAA